MFDRRSPIVHLLVIFFITVKRRLVGENAINICGNGTEHIFEY